MKEVLSQRMRGGVAIAAVILAVASSAYSADFQYESHGKRDPFVPLVGVDRPAFTRLEDVTSVTDIKLEGIASRSGGSRVAILNGEVVKKGDAFGSILIQDISDRKVIFTFGGKPYEISLYEEEPGGFKSGR